ncbi:type II secretion system protein [Thiomicrospira sp. ALE5]|uniref:type II secretion system protein n=1 Tax=Thiomicrospira sp. ALE5 TaxID=748650 RepID=UPI0008E9623C|nr:prepilin-type N-terminal cleavage/methylation domain-containing protein [Thiomicrospira sp. ALE5]SFR60642.1 prepilin-type N-terminal cleavage/methylation domain-containing protein [Thiomicrospira sp. ALE5]
MTSLIGIKQRRNNRISKMSRPAKQQGISLVEMMVVLAIIGLLMLSLWPMVHQLQTQHQHLQQERALNLAQDHLLFYLRQQGHLPCPSLTPNAAEARENDGRCQLQLGYLPTQALGLSSHQKIWYAVPASTRQYHELHNPASSASFWNHQPCYDQPQHHCFNRHTPAQALANEQSYQIHQNGELIAQGQLIWLGHPTAQLCDFTHWPARQACLIKQNQIHLPAQHLISWHSLHAMHLLQATGHLTH